MRKIEEEGKNMRKDVVKRRSTLFTFQVCAMIRFIKVRTEIS